MVKNNLYINTLLLVLFSNLAFCQAELRSVNFRLLKHFSYELYKYDSIIPVQRAGKYYFINTVTKKLVSDESFEEAYPFKGKCALIKKDGKYGMVDKQIHYAVMPTFSSPEGFFGKVIKDDNHIKRFNYNKARFDSTETFVWEDPIAPPIYYTTARNNKFYYGLRYNMTASPPIYDTIFSFNTNSIIVKLSGKYGMINYKGEVVVPINNKDFVSPTILPDASSSAYIALQKGLYWYYYKFNKLLFKNRLKPTAIGESIFVYKIGNLFNYFNDSGVRVLSNNYKWISASGNLAINKKNQVVILNRKREEFVYLDLDKNSIQKSYNYTGLFEP